MSNSRYRCQGCKNYHPTPPYRRVGLGGVCSEECIAKARSKPNSTTTTKPPKPKDEPDEATIAALYVRDRARCRMCGCQARGHSILGRLQVHHIRYRSEGVDHRLENLILLCDDHHNGGPRSVHANKKRWQRVCQLYVWIAMTENRRLLLPAIDRWLREYEKEERP